MKKKKNGGGSGNRRRTNVSTNFQCGYRKLLLLVQLCILFATGFCSMGVASLWIQKVDAPAAALCIVCNQVLQYGSRGSKTPVTVEIPEHTNCYRS